MEFWTKIWNNCKNNILVYYQNSEQINLYKFFKRRGLAFSKTKNYEEAILNYSKALKHLKNCPEQVLTKNIDKITSIQLNIALTYYYNGKNNLNTDNHFKSFEDFHQVIKFTEQAINSNKKILELDPENIKITKVIAIKYNFISLIYQEIGYLYFEKKIYDKSIEYFQQTIENYKLAIDFKEKILKLNPENKSIKEDISLNYYYISLNYKHIKNLYPTQNKKSIESVAIKEIDFLLKALELDPENDLANHTLAKMQFAKMQSQKGKIDQIEKDLKKNIEIIEYCKQKISPARKQSFTIAEKNDYHNLGNLYLEEGIYQKAIFNFSKALTLSQSHKEKERLKNKIKSVKRLLKKFSKEYDL